MEKTREAWQSSEDLAGARQQINQIDKKIVKLLRQRFEAASQVADIKKDRGLPVFDASREEAVLERVTAMDPDKGTRQYIWNIYRSIMENTRSFEHDQQR